MENNLRYEGAVHTEGVMYNVIMLKGRDTYGNKNETFIAFFVCDKSLILMHRKLIKVILQNEKR